MTGTRKRRTAALAAVAGLVLLLPGCGLGKDLYNTPLPGGADVGSDPIEITADFHDVVDLVPQSSVKVENIAVGRVSSIDLNPDGASARVTLLVRNDVDLPTGTTARLQQTSLLGEKYVALLRPASDAPSSGSLQSGANIAIEDTSQVAEIEQVLGALSLVVNGGGLAKFREISQELQQISTDRPDEIRGFLRNMEVFIGELDARKSSLTAALDAVADLSKTLESDRDKIANALEGLSPGLQVLVDQREQLVDMLGALDELGSTTIRTLNASQEDMTEDLRLLEPILGELAEAGDALPNSLELLLTYPFPDSVLGAIKGDYMNVFVTANYTSLPASCDRMGCAWPQPVDTGHTTEGRGDATARVGAPGTKDDGKGTKDTKDKKDSKPGKDVKPGKPQGPSAPAGIDVPASPGTSESPSPSASPSPTLLPPTDSALPGLSSPTVQVPVSESPTGTPTTPASED